MRLKMLEDCKTIYDKNNAESSETFSTKSRKVFPQSTEKLFTM